MKRDSGVSVVLGEVLMIALVLILVPTVTISLMNQMPGDRVPTVTILMKVNTDPNNPDIFENVTLFHKGGDYLKKKDISVIIRIKKPDGTFEEYGPYREENSQNVLDFTSSGYRVFDLSQSLTTTPDIHKQLGIGTIIYVSLISKNSVIYRGEKTYEG